MVLSGKFKGAQAGSRGFELDRPRLKGKLAFPELQSPPANMGVAVPALQE